MFAQQLNKKGMERAKYNNANDVAFLAFLSEARKILDPR